MGDAGGSGDAEAGACTCACTCACACACVSGSGGGAGASTATGARASSPDAGAGAQSAAPEGAGSGCATVLAPARVFGWRAHAVAYLRHWTSLLVPTTLASAAQSPALSLTPRTSRLCSAFVQPVVYGAVGFHTHRDTVDRKSRTRTMPSRRAMGGDCAPGDGALPRCGALGGDTARLVADGFAFCGLPSAPAGGAGGCGVVVDAGCWRVTQNATSGLFSPFEAVRGGATLRARYSLRCLPFVGAGPARATSQHTSPRTPGSAAHSHQRTVFVMARKRHGVLPRRLGSWAACPLSVVCATDVCGTRWVALARSSRHRGVAAFDAAL